MNHITSQWEWGADDELLGDLWDKESICHSLKRETAVSPVLSLCIMFRMF